ncbi:hypothetical protein PUN28_002391 [Cardiocondyla obscurior]|uniref:Uncharacterized protein n=1 Tax=Cardiocondyla obscurior TaxID=286306 RepID=A0AAW2GU01_9HYME
MPKESSLSTIAERGRPFNSTESMPAPKGMLDLRERVHGSLVTLFYERDGERVRARVYTCRVPSPSPARNARATARESKPNRLFSTENTYNKFIALCGPHRIDRVSGSVAE